MHLLHLEVTKFSRVDPPGRSPRPARTMYRLAPELSRQHHRATKQWRYSCARVLNNISIAGNQTRTCHAFPQAKNKEGLCRGAFEWAVASVAFCQTKASICRTARATLSHTLLSIRDQTSRWINAQSLQDKAVRTPLQVRNI